MNKKLLLIGFCALVVVGGIGYSIFGANDSSETITMKGSALNLGAVYQRATPSPAVNTPPADNAQVRLPAVDQRAIAAAAVGNQPQRVERAPQQSRADLVGTFYSSLANLSVLVNKYKAGSLLMGSCSPRAVEFSQNIATADSTVRNATSLLASRSTGQPNYLETNFIANAAQIRNYMSAISTSITMADALLRTVDFSNASACSTVPLEVRNFVFPGLYEANGSRITRALTQLSDAYYMIPR